MHSIYKIRKGEQEKDVQDRLLIRTQTRSPDSFREKNRRLAERYELRVDEWLMNSAQFGVETLETRQQACNHKFRDRAREKELGHSAISAGKYVFERDRIEATIQAQMVMRNRYNEGGSGLGRPRDESKEIQPRLRFAAQTEDERINDAISLNPVVPLQPWTRFDHPSMRKFREDNSSKWKSTKDFDLYRTSVGPRAPHPHDFLNSSIPFERAFGSKVDDFRPRAQGKELAGQFRNVVPGFHTDTVPGKWNMDLSLYSPSSPRIISPQEVSAQNSRSQEGANASGVASDLLNGLKFMTKMEKEYWKSGQQVSTAEPHFVESYEAIGDRQFDTYKERATTARNMVLEHFGHKVVGTKAAASRITPHESALNRKNKPPIALNTGDFAESG